LKSGLVGIVKPIKVIVVGDSQEGCSAWERRTGGILKDIATVGQAMNTEHKKILSSDLAVCYNGGEIHRELEALLNARSHNLLGLNLTLLPIGVKMLYSIGNNRRVGVVTKHVRCANLLLSEIITAGVNDHHFITGTFEQMTNMEVDVFVVAEEMVKELYRVVNVTELKRKIITVPRIIHGQSTAELIGSVIKISQSRLRDKRI